MPIANYTTRTSVHSSMLEVQHLLARAGAKSVRIDYQDGEPRALAFLLDVGRHEIAYRLPANADGMLAALRRDKKVPRHLCNREHADRVAWRVVKDWLRAQFALVEADQAKLAEVMLPYAITATGRTLYQELEERGPAMPAMLALEPPHQVGHARPPKPLWIKEECPCRST